MGRLVADRMVRRVSATGEVRSAPDALVVEEPLELRVSGSPLAVTMRTPGHDMDLMAGFLVTEGVVRRREELVAMRYCSGKDSQGRQTYNVLDATIAGRYGAGNGHAAELPVRSLVTTSACGLCGKASIDAVEVTSPYDIFSDPIVVEAAWICTLPDRLRQSQPLFARTGGLHAAGLVDPVTDDLLQVREDVGRHNALDKVIGWALRNERLPLAGTVLVLSGRSSFEMVQKASMAGIPVVAAVSAPTSLAVDLAARIGLTLIGFVRGGSMVIYSGGERVKT
jgi:FdhD protein